MRGLFVMRKADVGCRFCRNRNCRNRNFRLLLAALREPGIPVADSAAMLRFIIVILFRGATFVFYGRGLEWLAHGQEA